MTRFIFLKRRALRLFAAACTFTLPAAAQTPDTLDWQRYYPLAVGNLWEYHDAEILGDQFRHTLVSDTVVGDRTYFRRRIDRARTVQTPSGPDTLRLVSYDFVRYDEGSGTVVPLAAVERDTVAAQPCGYDGFQRDFRLGFGTQAACIPPSEIADSVRVEGTYDTTWTPELLSPSPSPPAVHVAAIKRYLVGALFSEFVADIGPAGSGNLGGVRLHYAVVGGVTYGVPEFAVGTEPLGVAQRSGLTLAVGPNPAGASALVTVTLSVPATSVSLAVYDARGREVLRLYSGPLGRNRSFTVPTSGLSAGLYTVHVVAEGTTATARLVVTN